MTEKYIAKDALGALITVVTSNGGRFVAPTLDARQVVYKEVTAAEAVVDVNDYILPRNSYKEIAFPQTEVLYKYELTRSGVDIDPVEVVARQTVVFGARPCEAASLASLNAVFTWDFIDEDFTKREESIVVLSVGCVNADDECFCTTVNLSPESTTGADVALYETENGYVATAITEKGTAFVEAHAGSFVDVAKGETKKTLATVEKVEGVDLTKLGERLAKTKNYDSPEWAELVRKCCGCGACTYSCPTCHCFDITDEGTAFEGERRKNWDACQFDHFTLHASGHNPRDTQYKRYRNRFMCKFHIYPTKFNSTGCVGCGRCIRVCPVRLDITDLMTAMSK
ncbi:MAG: 4Fe-4S dicluster domain-containing protein [Proteobacteria bacterium]|nr:4Fe-4S dicluster domain-containing protein [Pseudomonadota bacterium]